MKARQRSTSNASPGIVPGGRVFRAALCDVDDARHFGKGEVLPCDSPVLADPDVRREYERICRSHQLEDSALAIERAVAVASLNVELSRLGGKRSKSREDRKAIHRACVNVAACLTALSRHYVRRQKSST